MYTACSGRVDILLLHQSRFSHVSISPTECNDVVTLNYAKINPFPRDNDIQTRIIHVWHASEDCVKTVCFVWFHIVTLHQCIHIKYEFDILYVYYTYHVDPTPYIHVLFSSYLVKYTNIIIDYWNYYVICKRSWHDFLVWP